MKAVILAGGKGTRLRPYTLILPKPLIPVGDLPVVEILLKWLRRNGVMDVCITIGYLGHLIRAVCGDGSQWDMKISYSEEPEPLGTIGPLLKIREQLRDTFLVINGDVITDLNLRAFIAFHKKNGGPITIAGTGKKVNIDLGVLEIDGHRITGFQEKPPMHFLVSMGIYCLEPQILEYIPTGVPFGFDDLMYTLLDRDIPAHLYHHRGYWMDIGREEDFLEAQEDFQKDALASILGF